MPTLHFFFRFLASGFLAYTLLCSLCNAQYPGRSESRSLLQGAIDIHIHSAPDMFDRSVNDIELARSAKRAGLKAIVLKNHVSSTAGRAELANYAVEGIDVFGGIALNRAVGGINPEAVRSMARLSPRFGKVVWLPTFDATGHKRAHGVDEPGLGVLKGDTLTTVMQEVLDAISEYDLVLATGHLSPRETIAVVEAARAKGISRIVVTHALADAPGLSEAQIERIVENRAFLELTYLSYLSGPQSQLGFLKNAKHVPLAEMAQWIRTFGADSFILSSDLGQSGNPIPPDGLGHFVDGLMAEGISEAEIRLMLHDNPQTLLY